MRAETTTPIALHHWAAAAPASPAAFLNSRRAGSEDRLFPEVKLRPVEKLNDFFIGHRSKVLVISAHRIEALGYGEANNFVAFPRKVVEAIGRCNRNCNGKAFRPLSSRATKRRPNGGSRGDPIVDDDCGAAGNAKGSVVPAVEEAPPPDFL